MKRQKIKSSNLASVGYDPANKFLDVEFVKGGLYRYYDVPDDKFKGMMSSESHGKYFSAEIKNTYNSEKINTLDFVIDNLTADQKKKLLDHFNTIYKCAELTDHEYRIVYLAWLWANGFVYYDENGESVIDEKNSDLPLSTYEITFEADESGGVNLDYFNMYYGIDKIVKLTDWNEV